MAGVANRPGPPRQDSNAKHVSNTNSGHVIQMEQPQLVLDRNPASSSKQFVAGAIRWRATKRIPNCFRSPKARISRLKKALDEAFTKSGLHQAGVVFTPWLESTGPVCLAPAARRYNVEGHCKLPNESMNRRFSMSVLLIFLVSLIVSLDLPLTDAAERGNFAGLVDLGDGRKMYPEM